MSLRNVCLAALALVVAGLADRAHAQEYVVDAAHSAVVFRASHLGLSWTYGRFKDLSGTFAVDPQNPSGARFDLGARVDSLDTDNAQRDQHLKSPDFFNAKQYPTIRLRSSAVKPVDGGYEMTGELTLHGVTKPLTIVLRGGRTAEFPRGVHRTGFSGAFSIKRSEFGMDKMLEAIADEVHIEMSFEGTRK